MNKILLNSFINVIIYDSVSFPFHILDIIYINRYVGCIKLHRYDYIAGLCICDNYADCGLL